MKFIQNVLLDTIPEQLGRSVNFIIFINFVSCAPTVWAMIPAILEPLSNAMNVKSVITLKQSTRFITCICLLTVTWIYQANSTNCRLVTVCKVSRHFSCNWGPAQMFNTCLFYIYNNIFISLVKKVDKFEYPYLNMLFI